MVEIEAMDEDYIMLDCLHDGPADTSICEPDGDLEPGGLPSHPWSDKTIRELASEYPEISHGSCGEYPGVTREFMVEMIQRYETCAILAWEGARIVGIIRFFPLSIAHIIANAPRREPSVMAAGSSTLFEPDPKTLWVQCVMTSRAYASAKKIAGGTGAASRTMKEAGGRRGRGLKLVLSLVSWARERGWKRIVKHTNADLDCWYGISGNAGKALWQKAGFKVIGTSYDEPPKDKGSLNGWRVAVESQARAMGMSKTEAWTVFHMACEL